MVGLPIDFQALGEDDKSIGYAKFKRQFKLQDDEIAYIGDDELDIPILKQAGFACVPADAHAAARAVSHTVLPAKGGRGVLRCLADMLCAKKNDQALPNFDNSGPLVGIIGMNVIEDEALVHSVALKSKQLQMKSECRSSLKPHLTATGPRFIHTEAWE